MKNISKLLIASAAIATVAMTGCVKDEMSVFFARSFGETAEYLVEDKIPDFSGVCVNEDGTGLYGVSNAGALYNISFEGENLGKLPFESNKDFEGVTVDTDNKVVYMCEEAEWAIYKLNADKKGVTKVIDIPVENGVANKGFEGIAYGKGNLYVGNQADPTIIYTYNIAQNKVTGSMIVDHAGYISDLFYDATDDTLWSVDADKNLATHFTLDGEVLATYDASFVTKPEGIFIDYPRGVIWFSCDGSGRMYSAKINF